MGRIVFGFFNILTVLQLSLGGEVVTTENEPLTKKTKDTYPVGDPRHCMAQSQKPMLSFEVIPGGGWDNLRNKEMGMVMSLNYSRCRTTEDGRFLLPDGVHTIPIKSSRVETYAELIEHWDNFTSTLSRSVNLNAGLKLTHFGISGKFSDEYESVKSTQHYDKSMTTRVQVRYVQYSAKKEPDTMVDDAFKTRLQKIAAHIMLNHTDLARYESQLLIRDYGTHVITSIDVGAALVQVDEVNVAYVKKYESQKQTILASASASFFGIFDFGASYSQTTTQTMIDEYRKERTTSRILTFGGPVFQPKNFTANAWSSSLQNEMVALDRSGDPIYFVINDVILPGVPQAIVYDTYDYVKEAVALYYEHNTHRGCTNEDSPNFSFQANVDDGSCLPPKTNFTFGGVYQTCTGSGYINLCEGMIQNNPQTGTASCPAGYEAVPLQSGSKSSSRYRRECHSCWLFFHCCDSYTDWASASYSAFWCAATGTVPANSGFLFGGLYTPTVANVITQSQSCPLEFYPLKLLADLIVCVSDDYELGYRYSLPFAGFYSCNAGNPLALMERSNLLQSTGSKSMLTSYMMSSGVGSYPMTCPKGYSQHLAVVDNGCSIHYCVQAGALSGQGLPKVQRPPFMDAPRDKLSENQESTVVLDSNGKLWTNMGDAKKKILEFMAENGMDASMATVSSMYIGNTNGDKDSGNGLSGGGIAAISVSVSLICIVIGSAVFICLRRRKNRPYSNADPWSDRSESSSINASANRAYSGLDDPPTTVITSA